MNASKYVWPEKWISRESPMFPWFVTQYLILNNLTMTSVLDISKVTNVENGDRYANMCRLRNEKNKIPLQWYAAGDDVLIDEEEGVVLASLNKYALVELGSSGFSDILPPAYKDLGLKSWCFPVAGTDFVLVDKTQKRVGPGSKINIFTAMSVWINGAIMRQVGVGVPVYLKKEAVIRLISNNTELAPANTTYTSRITRDSVADWYATSGSEPYQLVNPYLTSPGGLDRMLVVHSTGSGKTLVVANIINVWFRSNVLKCVEYWRAVKDTARMRPDGKKMLEKPTTLRNFLECNGEAAAFGVKKIFVIVPTPQIAAHTRRECVKIRGLISDVAMMFRTGTHGSWERELLTKFVGEMALPTETRQVALSAEREAELNKVLNTIFFIGSYITAGNNMPWYDMGEGVMVKHTAGTRYTAGRGNRMSKNPEKFGCDVEFGNPFDNSVVIMDEFHNACNDHITMPGWQASIPRVRMGISTAENAVIVGLTATPVTEGVDDLRVAVNILRGFNKPQINARDWIGADGHLTDDTKLLMQGYVSVYDVVNDYHLFPSITPRSDDPLFQQPTYIHVPMTPALKPTYDKHNCNHISRKLNKQAVLKTPVDWNSVYVGQVIIMVTGDDNEDNEDGKEDKEDDKDKELKFESFIVSDVSKTVIRQKKKETTTINSISLQKYGTPKFTDGLEGNKRKPVGAEKIIITRDTPIFHPVWEVKEYSPGAEPGRTRQFCLMNSAAAKGLERGPPFNYEVGTNPKVDRLVELLHDKVGGKKLVFCDYNATGLATLRAALLRSGEWEQWDMEQWNMEQWNMEQLGANPSKKRRFMLLNDHCGPTYPGLASKKKQDAALNWFMEKKSIKSGTPDFDFTGSVVELALLSTPSYYQGVDFKSIRTLYILDPPADMRMYTQIIGRVRRMCSHANLSSMSNWTSEIIMLLIRDNINKKTTNDDRNDDTDDDNDDDDNDEIGGEGGEFKITYRQLASIKEKKEDDDKEDDDNELFKIYREIFSMACATSATLYADMKIDEMLDEYVSLDAWTWIKACASYFPTKTILEDLKSVAVDCVTNSVRMGGGGSTCAALAPIRRSTDGALKIRDESWLNIPYIKGIIDGVITDATKKNKNVDVTSLLGPTKSALERTFVGAIDDATLKGAIENLYVERFVQKLNAMTLNVRNTGTEVRLLCNVTLKDSRVPNRVAWYASCACPIKLQDTVVVTDIIDTHVTLSPITQFPETRNARALQLFAKLMKDRQILVKKLPKYYQTNGEIKGIKKIVTILKELNIKKEEQNNKRRDYAYACKQIDERLKGDSEKQDIEKQAAHDLIYNNVSGQKNRYRIEREKNELLAEYIRLGGGDGTTDNIMEELPALRKKAAHDKKLKLKNKYKKQGEAVETLRERLNLLRKLKGGGGPGESPTKLRGGQIDDLMKELLVNLRKYPKNVDKIFKNDKQELTKRIADEQNAREKLLELERLGGLKYSPTRMSPSKYAALLTDLKQRQTELKRGQAEIKRKNQNARKKLAELARLHSSAPRYTPTGMSPGTYEKLMADLTNRKKRERVAANKAVPDAIEFENYKLLHDMLPEYDAEEKRVKEEVDVRMKSYNNAQKERVKKENKEADELVKEFLKQEKKQEKKQDEPKKETFEQLLRGLQAATNKARVIQPQLTNPQLTNPQIKRQPKIHVGGSAYFSPRSHSTTFNKQLKEYIKRNHPAKYRNLKKMKKQGDVNYAPEQARFKHEIISKLLNVGGKQIVREHAMAEAHKKRIQKELKKQEKDQNMKLEQQEQQQEQEQVKPRSFIEEIIED